MKNLWSRVPALTLALLVSTAGLLAQKGGSGAELMVSVTVSPICTVDVRAGARSASRPVDLRCRNFAVTQPEPRVTLTPAASLVDEHAVVDPAGLAALEMIVINF